MSTADDKKITIIPFDGTIKQWRMQRIKFLARARCRGYKAILTADVIVPEDGRTTHTNDEGRFEI